MKSFFFCLLFTLGLADEYVADCDFRYNFVSYVKVANEIFSEGDIAWCEFDGVNNLTIGEVEGELTVFLPKLTGAVAFLDKECEKIEKGISEGFIKAYIPLLTDSKKVVNSDELMPKELSVYKLQSSDLSYLVVQQKMKVDFDVYKLKRDKDTSYLICTKLTGEDRRNVIEKTGRYLDGKAGN